MRFPKSEDLRGSLLIAGGAAIAERVPRAPEGGDAAQIADDRSVLTCSEELPRQGEVGSERAEQSRGIDIAGGEQLRCRRSRVTALDVHLAAQDVSVMDEVGVRRRRLAGRYGERKACVTAHWYGREP